VAVSDIDPDRWNGAYPAAFLDPPAFLDAALDLAVVCLPHESATVVTRDLLARGVSVLVEKPLGRSAAEAADLQSHAGDARLHVGFNFRFLPPLAALVTDALAGEFGQLISVDVEFGHGGSPGDAQSWKLNPTAAGGGVLLDPGIHVLDLVCGLAQGDLVIHSVVGSSPFWGTGIEEHAEILMSDSGATIIRVGVSLVKWRSTFRVFVLGTEGYGEVTGRSRSYGAQQYCRGRRWGWQSGMTQRDSEWLVLRTETDDSLAAELAAILAGIPSLGWAMVPASGSAACAVMGIYERVRERLTWL